VYQSLLLVVHTDDDPHVIFCGVGLLGKGRIEDTIIYPRLPDGVPEGDAVHRHPI